MEKNFQKLFQNLETKTYSKELPDIIFSKIDAEIKRALQIKLVLFSTAALGSLASIITSSTYLWQSFKQSGFYDYLSLIFSDNTALLSYSKEFALTLLESLPVVGTILFLGALGLFVWSSARAMGNARSIYLSA